MSDVLARENVVAWCVVPYDAKERGPLERAEMLARLGISRLAWDWRPQHVEHLGEELVALDELGIELTGIWLPAFLPSDDGELGSLDPDVERILEILRERGRATQLWTCTELGPPGPFEPLPAGEHQAMLERTVTHLVPLAERALADGHTIGLYAHLGWAGEPENLLEVLDALADRVPVPSGVVYVQHHGHAHVDRFAEILASVGERLLALGMNGMLPGAHWGDGKVYPLGHGPRDLELARIVLDSGWQGPVCLLGHTMDDVELRLLDNLEGLDWLRARLGLSGSPEDAPAQPPAARVPNPRWPH